MLISQKGQNFIPPKLSSTAANILDLEKIILYVRKQSSYFLQSTKGIIFIRTSLSFARKLKKVAKENIKNKGV